MIVAVKENAQTSEGVFKECTSFCRRIWLGKIVGSGPGGFYTAKLLLREIDGATVDIFERELVPFGRIRVGVAPDHQPMKRTANDMGIVGDQPGLRFHGGVNIVGIELKF